MKKLQTPQGAPNFESLLLYRARITQSSQAPRTRSEYARDCKRFAEWCEKAHRCAFPATAETVIFYLTDMLTKGRRVTSVTRYVSAIKDWHRSGRIPAPDGEQIRAFLAGAQRLRQEQPNQKTALSVEHLRRMCSRLMTAEPRDARDRAILTLGFASALRRSNLMALDVGDIRQVPQGIILIVRREKQDQEGRGRLIGVSFGTHPETCPVSALNAWLRIRGDSPGAVFTAFSRSGPLSRRLNGKEVARVVKEGAEGIGIRGVGYGGHSLRSGFVTAAVENGVNEFVIASQTGHRSLSSLRRYFRVADPFRSNASTMVGL